MADNNVNIQQCFLSYDSKEMQALLEEVEPTRTVTTYLFPLTVLTVDGTETACDANISLSIITCGGPWPNVMATRSGACHPIYPKLHHKTCRINEQSSMLMFQNCFAA